MCPDRGADRGQERSESHSPWAAELARHGAPSLPQQPASRALPTAPPLPWATPCWKVLEGGIGSCRMRSRAFYCNSSREANQAPLEAPAICCGGGPFTAARVQPALRQSRSCKKQGRRLKASSYSGADGKISSDGEQGHPGIRVKTRPQAQGRHRPRTRSRPRTRRSPLPGRWVHICT